MEPLLTESIQPAEADAGRLRAAGAWVRAGLVRLRGEKPWEFVVLFVMTSFLLFFGLVPLLGGDQVGLVGADEPRYAQIAREMLHAHNDACQAANAEIMPRGLSGKDLYGSYRCAAGR
jgi:hypothetical protein